jgi:hypothetical protein
MSTASARLDPLTGLLLVATAAFALLVYYQLEGRPDQDWTAPVAEARSSAKPSPPPPAPAFVMPPQETYTDVLARPPFVEGRQPSKGGGPAREPGPPIGAVLVGIVVGPESRHALIGHSDAARVTRVREGQEIDGWSVESIRHDRLVLKRGDVVSTIKFRETATGANASTTALLRPVQAAQPSVSQMAAPSSGEPRPPSSAGLRPAPSTGQSRRPADQQSQRPTGQR